jgi:hypothetical protein
VTATLSVTGTATKSVRRLYETKAVAAQIKQITGQAINGNASPNDHFHKKLEINAMFNRIEKPIAANNEDQWPLHQRPGNPGQLHSNNGPQRMGDLQVPIKNTTGKHRCGNKICQSRFPVTNKYQSGRKIGQSQSKNRFRGILRGTINDRLRMIYT